MLPTVKPNECKYGGQHDYELFDYEGTAKTYYGDREKYQGVCVRCGKHEPCFIDFYTRNQLKRSDE